jgi:uncharacterized protein with HEPN domain
MTPVREYADYLLDISDKLSHEYFGVDLHVVWKTVKEDLPKLKANLKPVIDQCT